MLKNTLVSPEQKAPQEETGPIAVGVSQAAQQLTPRNIGLIIAYEYKKRLSQRSSKISTIVILILIMLGSFVPTIVAYVGSIVNTQKNVVVVNIAGPIAGMNNDALLTYIDTTLSGTTQGQNASGKPAFSITMGSADTSGSLQKQVKDGAVNSLLVLERAPNQDVQFTYTTNANPIGDSNVTKVQGLAGQLSLLDKASRLGLTPDQTSTLFNQPQFTVVNLGAPNDRSTSDIVAGYVIAYVGIMLIFMSIYLYGYGVAMGVAEEKGEPYHGDSGECSHAVPVNGWENTRHRCGRAHPDDGFRGGGHRCAPVTNSHRRRALGQHYWRAEPGYHQQFDYTAAAAGLLYPGLLAVRLALRCDGSPGEAARGGAERGTTAHVAVFDWLPDQLLWHVEPQCDVGEGGFIYSFLDAHDHAHADCHRQRDLVGNCSVHRVDDCCRFHLHCDLSPHLPLRCADVWPEALDAPIDEAGPHEMTKHARVCSIEQ